MEIICAKARTRINRPPHRLIRPKPIQLAIGRTMGAALGGVGLLRGHRCAPHRRAMQKIKAAERNMAIHKNTVFSIDLRISHK